MTLQDKQLLLADLCARLPYHPNIKVYNDGWDGMQIGEIDTNLWTHHIDAFWCSRIEITPYLRPLSSITEEETKQYESICDLYMNSQGVKHFFNNVATIDWYNRKHFDYRGLIDKGLALPAPEGMYNK